MTSVDLNKYSRTLDDVTKLAKYAKLDINDLHPNMQTLSFPENYKNSQNLKLIEVDSEILKYVCEGKRVVIRGCKDDTTVLCTDSKTYEVREAETSNALFLSPDLKIVGNEDNECDYNISKHEIEEIHYKYYELKQCKPRYSKLIKLLGENTFKGENEEHNTARIYSWDDLINFVQCSEDEIKIGLEEIMAYRIGDFWQLLDFDYHFNVLSQILNLIESNSLSIDSISKQETLKSVSGTHPEFILDQCFEYFFCDKNETNDKGEDMYKINSEMVSRICAEVLLRSAGKFNLTEFESIWQQSVPNGVVTDLSFLRGVALVDKTSTPPLISHLPVTDMPDELLDRIGVLFHTMDVWEYRDIEPYLKQFSTASVSVRSLLVKHAKMAKRGDQEFYIKRHSK